MFSPPYSLVILNQSPNSTPSETTTAMGAHMDAIHQISNESFSNGWLNHIKPCLDRLGDSLRRSFDSLDSTFFIEVDPDFFSMRWTDSTGFNFNLPSCDSSALIHADQLFSSGRLLPLHLVDPLKCKQGSVPSDSVLQRSISLDSNSTDSTPSLCSSQSMPLSSGASKLRLPLLSHGTKPSGKMLRKLLYFLIPLCKKVKSLKMISSRTSRSCGGSPRMTAFSGIDRRRGSKVFGRDSDSSIHDAVLHCKRSIANSAGGGL